tara:strand:- start:271 stop:765 length:495 start_codon:yes stop_codon:yes gene_type:complete
MPTFTFKTEATEAARKGDAAKAAMALAIDAMVADDITLEHFKAGGIGDESGFRALLKEAIFDSFDDDTKALLNLPKDAVPENQKEYRRRKQMSIGSRVKDFKNAFKRRVEPTEPGANNRTDDKTFLIERLAACIKRVQKSEEASFDTVKVTESLKAAIKAVQTK